MAIGRPPKVDTIQFRRKLDQPRRLVMLAAGQGNISEGFENLLALYQHCHSIGYRPDMPLQSIDLVTKDSATTNSPNAEEPVRER